MIFASLQVTPKFHSVGRAPFLDLKRCIIGEPAIRHWKVRKRRSRERDVGTMEGGKVEGRWREDGVPHGNVTGVGGGGNNEMGGGGKMERWLMNG